jgi:F-type H+-transporting ATPase subunit b
MDEREAKIASRLQSAKDKEQAAEREMETYRKRKAELEQERDRLLDQAREEAESRRGELIRDARQEVEDSRKRWHQGLQQQRERFLASLRRRSGEQAQRIARKALQDLAEEELDKRIGRVFLKRLKNLEAQDRGEIERRLRDSGRARLATAFDLPQSLQGELKEELAAIAGGEVQLDHETDPELIAGVELKVQDKKIAFSLEQYLDDLEQTLNRILDGELEASHA